MRDYVILALLVSSLPFCFVRPFFGILMWNVVSFLNPHRFAWGIAYTFPAAQAVALPTLAGFVILSSDWKRFFSRDVWLIVLLWIWFTFTTVHNTDVPLFMHFKQDTWFRWQFVSKIFLMTLTMVAIVNTWERFRWLLLVISGCFALLVLKAVPFMILTAGSFRLYGPPGSMIADNNDLALTLNMTLPMLFCLAMTVTNKWLKRILWISAIATIPAVLFTYSRGGLIGLSLVLVLMVMRLRQRFLLLPVLFIACLFAVFLTPDKWQRRMDFSREGALMDDSALSRINAWTYSWNLAKDYPLTGAGFEAFTPELFSRYAPNPKDVHGPHSIYFGVLAEHGFIGLFLYLTLLISCFWRLRWVNNYARTTGHDLASSYAAMLKFSLLAFMVSGAFLGRAYFDYYFTIVALTVILKRLCQSDLAQSHFEEPEEELVHVGNTV